MASTTTSDSVAVQARAQYGCKTQTFMELEDQGGSGTDHSHWKRRSAKDELMDGISGVGHYTALTIAAMEDMGFYKGNYTNAESMSYGQNAGCALTTSKCVIGGVSQFPKMFCNDASKNIVCTSDHTALGTCQLESHVTALPSYFQYFSDASYGGADPLMDYCPYMHDAVNLNCTVSTGMLSGGIHGVNARGLLLPIGFETGGTIHFRPASHLRGCALWDLELQGEGARSFHLHRLRPRCHQETMHPQLQLLQ